jgi:hypothetical protein
MLGRSLKSEFGSPCEEGDEDEDIDFSHSLPSPPQVQVTRCIEEGCIHSPHAQPSMSLVHGQSRVLHYMAIHRFPTANKHMVVSEGKRPRPSCLLKIDLHCSFLCNQPNCQYLGPFAASSSTHSSFNVSVTMHILILLNIMFLCLQVNLSAVYAKCCLSDAGGDCGDNSSGSPCCGYNKCNGFCCACPGGKPMSHLT